MADEKTERPAPIYVSYLTFTTLLDWLRDAKIIPSQFDRSYWGGKFSGSTGAQLMSGLRFLGLLNGDKPDDRLESIAFASDDERPALIRALLEDVYGQELVGGLARATPATLNAALRALGTTDATHDKARSFFVNAAKAVELQMPSQIAKQARNRPPVSRKGTASKGRKPGGSGQSASQTPPAPLIVDERAKKLSPLLENLIDDLARIAPTWTAAAQKNWKLMWDTALNYTYPVRGDRDAESNAEDSEV
jgi:hypothetical protein